MLLTVKQKVFNIRTNVAHTLKYWLTKLNIRHTFVKRSKTNFVMLTIKRDLTLSLSAVQNSVVHRAIIVRIYAEFLHQKRLSIRFFPLAHGIFSLSKTKLQIPYYCLHVNGVCSKSGFC